MKNPPWTRDELILALDLYFREPDARVSEDHPEVIELSKLLNTLPIHGDGSNQLTFRNPNGVVMKLRNFLSHDPTYEGAGLRSGGKNDKAVWDEYADNIQILRKCAISIIANAEFNHSGLPTLDPDESEAPEGRLLTKIHRYRERDRKIIRKKKEKVLNELGHLKCEVCGFDFALVYPSLGNGFCECHHEKPVCELSPGEKTKLSDLRIFCSNCHRMIHRKRPWLNVDSLKANINTLA